MNNNYELVKQGFNKDANERYYLFECKPQKRTIICRSKYDIPFATYNVSLDKHYFLIITVDHLLKKAYMGEAISSIVNSDKILAMAYNFNGNSPGIHCGGPDYADMSFRKADFPKFLSMFWQSAFMSYTIVGKTDQFDFFPTSFAKHEIPVEEENE